MNRLVFGDSVYNTVHASASPTSFAWYGGQESPVIYVMFHNLVSPGGEYYIRNADSASDAITFSIGFARYDSSAKYWVWYHSLLSNTAKARIVAENGAWSVYMPEFLVRGLTRFQTWDTVKVSANMIQ